MVYGNQANLDKTLSQFPHSYCKQHNTECMYIFKNTKNISIQWQTSIKYLKLY